MISTLMDHPVPLPAASRQNRVAKAIFFALILLLAAFLRFQGLGTRSLWGDEFCTWKVAQMPLRESLRWQPELTKPPVYQFILRGIAITGAPSGSMPHEAQPSPQPSPGGRGSMVHPDANYLVPVPQGVPSEWHLRLPAAICGTLAVAAMWWLGTLAGGWTVAAAAGLLLAINGLQIHYSQEARPYSMLMLGSVVSTGIWFRLRTRQQGNEATRQRTEEKTEEFRKKAVWIWYIAYVLVTSLTFHANYLIVLTVAAHAIWGAAMALKKSQISNLKLQRQSIAAPAFALLATALLCMPMVWHFLRNRTSVFQGLDWIPPATISSTLRVLTEISFGWIWVWILLVPAVVWVVRTRLRIGDDPAACGEDTAYRIQKISPRAAPRPSNPSAFCWLLLVWLAAAWIGLLFISWIAHPAMVARYALPAAAPAVLLPLVLLHQIDRRLPLMVAVAVATGTAPVWLTRAEHVKPGFREMVAFLDEYVNPATEALVVAIERTTSPGWEEMDLLGFEYYSSSKFDPRCSKKINEAARRDEASNKGNSTLPGRQDATWANSLIEVLYLRESKPDGHQPILQDPRALWVVTFLADPMKAMESSGRRVEQIEIGGKVFDQLYFEPYRLIRVAAKG